MSDETTHQGDHARPGNLGRPNVSARSLVSKAAFGAAWAAGGRFTLRPRIVLMYHSVARSAELDHLTVDTSEFIWQLNFISRHYEFATVGEVLDSSNDEPRVALTFDDGYAHLLPEVAQILSENKVPTLFYVSSSLLGKKISTSYGTCDVMTDDDLRYLHATGFSIGSHTRTHAKLPELTVGNARDEIEGSKADLEDCLGSAVPDFAYPKGALNPRVRDLVTAAGYHRATTVLAKTVSPNDDPFLIPRVGVYRSTSRSRFKLGLSRYGDAYAALRRHGRDVTQLD